MFKKQVATKEQVKLMLALTGPSGSGKTFSALQLGYGITGDWSKIAVADTENRSALYYAGARTGAWEHIDFPPTIEGGYHPTNWIRLIEFVENDPKIEVLILDSISHEWGMSGGALSLVDNLSKSAKGNTFTPWKTVTPLHNAFIDKMRNSRLHIIATMRSKVEYSIEKNELGKSAPKKIGTTQVQREGTDYEFGVMFDIDVEHHYATSSKDRTGLFAGKPPFLISPEIGKRLVAWSKEGELTSHSPKALEIFHKETHAEKLKGFLEKKYSEQGRRDKFLELMEGRPMSQASVIAVEGEMFEIETNAFTG